MDYDDAGTMGNDEEISWYFKKQPAELTVSGPVSDQNPIYVAVYNDVGKMELLRTITKEGTTTWNSDSENGVELIWLNNRMMPNCREANINY